MKYLGPSGDLDHGPCLDVDLDDSVLTIVLNRPQQCNAINVEINLALGRLLAVLNRDDAVRVLVLRCNGPAFGVGLEPDGLSDVTSHAAQQLRTLVQPVIARVHGSCHGGAMRLIEACDIVIAADDADFNATGQSFDAKEAQHQGLVTFSVPASELQAHTDTLARELAAKDALALRFTKQTLQRVPNIPWDEVLAFTSAKQAELKALQAGRPSARASAIASFLAGKSKPGAGA